MISMEKGTRINLGKEAPEMKKLKVGLGWDKKTSGGDNFDIDASMLCLKGEHIKTQDDILYFGNKEIGNGALVHSGDNLTGEGNGPDETIFVDLEKVSALGYTAIDIVATVFKAKERKQNFGQINNAFMQLENEDGEIIAKYDLTEDFSTSTAIKFGTLYMKDGSWRVSAEGIGSVDSLEELFNKKLDPEA